MSENAAILKPPTALDYSLTGVNSVLAVEKGLAEAAAMKPYAKPFLQIDKANFYGLIFSLMAATAALPQLLQRALTVASPAAGSRAGSRNSSRARRRCGCPL